MWGRSGSRWGGGVDLGVGGKVRVDLGVGGEVRVDLGVGGKVRVDLGVVSRRSWSNYDHVHMDEILKDLTKIY